MKLKLEQTLKQIESGRQLVERLEKIVDKFNETFGEISLLECLEEEIQEEKPYAADGHIAISGLSTNTGLSWNFNDIVEAWLDVYRDDEDGAEALRKMASEFRTLAEMFDQAAAKLTRKN
jgi:hypothetical protein